MSTADKHFEKKDIQTELKHALLEIYLLKWAKVLSDASYGTSLKRVNFVDCFAGRGTFEDGQSGSPTLHSKCY